MEINIWTLPLALKQSHEATEKSLPDFLTQLGGVWKGTMGQNHTEKNSKSIQGIK